MLEYAQFDKLNFILDSTANRYKIVLPALNPNAQRLFPNFLKRAKTWNKSFKSYECLEANRNEIFTFLNPTSFPNIYTGNFYNDKNKSFLIHFHNLTIDTNTISYMDIYVLNSLNTSEATEVRIFADKFIIVQNLIEKYYNQKITA